MPNLNEIHSRLQQKKKEHREINRSLQDELSADARYKEIVGQLKKLREEKKSIENQTRALAGADAAKLDTLKLDIESDAELLADVALNMYAQGQSIEVVDQNGVRWLPSFSIKFKKEQSTDEAVPKREAAEALVAA